MTTTPRLWEKFVRLWNRDELASCYSCPHATKTERMEPRVDPKRFPGLDKSWYALVDRSTFKPTKTDKACVACFDSWAEDRKSEGKICTKCGAWITKENEGMMIIAQYGDEKGKTHTGEKTAVCGQCLTGGKTPEEWARATVERLQQSRAEKRQPKYSVGQKGQAKHPSGTATELGGTR